MREGLFKGVFHTRSFGNFMADFTIDAYLVKYFQRLALIAAFENMIHVDYPISF